MREVHIHHHYTPESSRSTCERALSTRRSSSSESYYRYEYENYADARGRRRRTVSSSPALHCQSQEDYARDPSSPVYDRSFGRRHRSCVPPHKKSAPGCVYYCGAPGRARSADHWRSSSAGFVRNPFDQLRPAGKTGGLPQDGKDYFMRSYCWSPANTAHHGFGKTMAASLPRLAMGVTKSGYRGPVVPIRSANYPTTLHATMGFSHAAPWGGAYPDPLSYMTPRTLMAQTTVSQIPMNPSAKMDHFSESTLRPGRDLTTIGCRNQTSWKG